MANALIAFPNLADKATLAGGSWSTTLPLANLQTRFVGQPARSASVLATATQFTATLPANRSVRVVALVNHSLTGVAQYRVRVYSDAGATVQVADTGTVNAFPLIYRDGTITDEDRAGRRWTLPVVLSSTVSARVVKVEIIDTANAAGFVDIGRLFFGPAWQPARNFSYGADIGWEDPSGLVKSLGGVKHWDRQQRYRTARVALDHLTLDEAFAGPWEISERAGLTEEVFWVTDPADTTHLLRRSFLASLKALSPIRYPYPLQGASAFELEEIV